MEFSLTFHVREPNSLWGEFGGGSTSPGVLKSVTFKTFFLYGEKCKDYSLYMVF